MILSHSMDWIPGPGWELHTSGVQPLFGGMDDGEMKVGLGEDEV